MGKRIARPNTKRKLPNVMNKKQLLQLFEVIDDTHVFMGSLLALSCGLRVREVVMKYGATGSSLWIGTYIDGEFHKEENTNVWYKVRDEDDFTSYLKELLDKRLSGELS